MQFWAQIGFLCLAVLGTVININREVRRATGPVVLKQQTAGDSVFSIIFATSLSWFLYVFSGAFSLLFGWPN